MTNQPNIQEQDNAKSNMTLACFFNNVALKFLEAALLDKDKDVNRTLIRSYINKLKFVETDCLSRIQGDDNRQMFRDEISHGDTLMFANIGITVMQMNEQQRASFERLIIAIKKNEAVEITTEISEDDTLQVEEENLES